MALKLILIALLLAAALALVAACSLVEPPYAGDRYGRFEPVPNAACERRMEADPHWHCW